ncbi:chemokine C-C motif receptor-like 2 [Coccinella septempunctata]|uniref:chemokine C-C motif receptor-like 2 n=1 Tax=Coccinella septempunctata TaxID=41139 RepID=UPI001D065F6C|nr:chemokine C-C motif receptor-like 2 [Coccinella septempunctata]
MDESLLNFSRVEEDPFAKIPLENVSETPYRHSPVSSALNYFFFTAELLNFFLGIASVISDVLIIYFIFRYKRLKKNINLYIANYAIMNLCYYVVAPVLLLVHVLFSLGLPHFMYVFCYVSMMENTFLMSSFLFATLLAVDWTLSCVRPECLKKFHRILKIKYPIIYGYIMIVMISSCLGCMMEYELVQSLLFYNMPLIIFALIVMHNIRRKRVLSSEHLKTEYALWIFTIAVGCFIPIYILDLILIAMGPYSYHTFTLIIFALEYILSFFSTPAPVFILYYLIKWNKYFKMAFDTTFKRAVRSYGADNLDDASDNEEIVQDGEQKNVPSEVNGVSRAEILVP